MTIQRSFSSGEVAPALYGRADVDRWKAALQLCKNWIVKPEGGIDVRQGFELKASIAGTSVRMIPFEFGPTDSYVLAVVNEDMYVIRNGALVKYDVAPTVDYFLPFTMTKESLRWVQSGDTLYMVDGVHVPAKLVREKLGSTVGDTTRHDNWTLGNAPMTPTITAGIAVDITPAGGSDQIRYCVTYTDKAGAESSIIRGATTDGVLSSVSSRWNVLFVAHGLETNDSIEIVTAKSDDLSVRVYEAGDIVRVQKVDADNFSIVGNTSAVSGILQYRKLGDSELANQPTTAAPRTITWGAVTGADYYNVYREYGRVFGYIGSTSDLTFSDPGIVPDIKDTPIKGVDPTRTISAAGRNIPTAVGLFQQRLTYGGYSEDTERITASHIGNYSAFDPGAEDASGLDFELAGRTVSGIQHMLEIAGRSVVLTNTAEWILRGGVTGGLTPTAINARVDSYHGSSSVVPALVGTSLLFVQRGNRIVRDATYDYSQEALVSKDLTLWAKHLFNVDIIRVVYQRTAGIVWCLRDDGILLGLTYIPDQSVWGWHQHQIAGREIKDICVVSEDNEDRLYIATIHDSVVRISRLPSEWTTEDVDDFKGFDEGLGYDGTLTGTATLSGGTNWYTSETLTLTSTIAAFSAGDVGVDFLLRDSDTGRVYVTVQAYTNPTQVTVRGRSIIPTTLQGVASDSWARCASTVSGLDHLEGHSVGIVADGGAEAPKVVSGGAITLDRPFARIQAGLIVTADAKTLDLESTDKDTNLGDFKHITRVILRVSNSRGVEVGTNEDNLEPMFVSYTEPLSNAVPELQSGAREVLMDAAHELAGSVLIRQASGLPASILNVRPVFNEGSMR